MLFVFLNKLKKKIKKKRRAKLEEICELGRTDNVQREISEHIFQVKWKQEKLFLLMDVILFIILKLK